MDAFAKPSAFCICHLVNLVHLIYLIRPHLDLGQAYRPSHLPICHVEMKLEIWVFTSSSDHARPQIDELDEIWTELTLRPISLAGYEDRVPLFLPKHPEYLLEVGFLTDILQRSSRDQHLVDNDVINVMTSCSMVS